MSSRRILRILKVPILLTQDSHLDLVTYATCETCTPHKPDVLLKLNEYAAFCS